MHRNDSETSVGFRVFCSSVADRNKTAEATTAVVNILLALRGYYGKHGMLRIRKKTELVSPST